MRPQRRPIGTDAARQTMTNERQRKTTRRLLVLPLLLLVAPLAVAQFPESDGGDLQPGTLPLAWNTGGPSAWRCPSGRYTSTTPIFTSCANQAARMRRCLFCICSSARTRAAVGHRVPQRQPSAGVAAGGAQVARAESSEPYHSHRHALPLA
jgi:hypothetical protein